MTFQGANFNLEFNARNDMFVESIPKNLKSFVSFLREMEDIKRGGNVIYAEDQLINRKLMHLQFKELGCLSLLRNF